MLHMNYGANIISLLRPKISVPQCPDEGTDGRHHGFFLELLTGFLPMETTVGTRGGVMHALFLHSLLSGYKYHSSEASSYSCLMSQRIYYSKSLSLAKTKFNQLQKML